MSQNTILDKKTSGVLHQVFSIPYIKKNFALAGGTALALQIGHRLSIDLDFFAPKPFLIPTLQDTLRKNFKELYEPVRTGRMMFFAKINHVKTVFVMELRPLLMKFVEKGNIKLFSVPDIAAMKLHTICGRGRKKDFFDVYALLQIYSWNELRDFFIKKYSEYELLFLNRSIDYFSDADKDPDVVGQAPYKTKWADIKKFIKNNCR